MTTQPVLLVEDNPDDVFFMRRAFKVAGIANGLEVAEDGRAATEYLSAAGSFSDRQKFPLPCLILLDLKLPHVPGLEVLKWIREQPHLRRIVVIVLTSSHLDVDIERAYSLGANSYLVKPPNASSLNDMVRRIKEYWFEMNQFPPLAGDDARFNSTTDTSCRADAARSRVL